MIYNDSVKLKHTHKLSCLDVHVVKGDLLGSHLKLWFNMVI